MQIDFLDKSISEYQGNRYSELKQDVLALCVSNNKRGGFFVEFGTMDGIFASNTYLLEKDWGWQGIVCEPGRTFHEDLYRNRCCQIDTRAVTGCSGDHLDFKETEVQLGLSGLVDYFDPQERHARRRRTSSGNIYQVETVSLLDLLNQHQCPTHIDYISMDTEGSELAILENFDFSAYEIDLFTIEHNNHPTKRDQIKNLMESKGYVNILTDRSKYDDWYIRRSLLEE